MIDNISGEKVRDMSGEVIPLSDYKGKVLFEILGFPCNDFGKQEPGSNNEIIEFCSDNYKITFKLFDKIKILGSEKEPLYQVLTNNNVTGHSEVKWNFEKFLISKEGKILARFRSWVRPTGKKIISKIEEALQN